MRKKITATGCWAPLWEQLGMQLYSTHQKVFSHVQNKEEISQTQNRFDLRILY